VVSYVQNTGIYDQNQEPHLNPLLNKERVPKAGEVNYILNYALMDV